MLYSMQARFYTMQPCVTPQHLQQSRDWAIFSPNQRLAREFRGPAEPQLDPQSIAPHPRPRLKVQGNSRLGRDRPLTYSLFSSSHTPTPPTPQCLTRYFNNKLRLLHKNHRPFQ
ncbi:hypothetical protein PGT21_033045 [Puccinia graminis f. sp. tritici]|uniref:Uncharacterized protein n=1 Tax=Puccinia graminis f. sp. tritici TaxID=56615 RepID=A0A5B0LQ25_PUCGR|nr:hypothetical protein PGT21_033045 [Puccinia graminis f. sp. tritici]